MIRVADYIMQRIYEQGAKTVFMVTGRGILYLTDAVAKMEEMNVVCMHHEQAAAYAAVAYAQKNERIGACLVSTGCGATNAITGALCAWQDSVPCIFVSGQNMLEETTRYTRLPIRTYGSQEADIVSLVSPIMKYTVMLTKGEDVAYEMDRLFYEMDHGRKGPVWLDVPLDVQNQRVDPEKLERYLFIEREQESECSKEAADGICEMLFRAERPVVLIGNGIRLAGACDTFRNFIERTHLPVVYTPSATDVYGSGNKYSVGAIGSIGGTREGNFAVQNADFVLVLGCSLTSAQTGKAEEFARDADIVVVDIDKEQHRKKGVHIKQIYICDVGKMLGGLLKSKLPVVPEEWILKCMHWKDIFPLGKKEYDAGSRVDLYYLAENLADAMPEEGVVVCDAGFEELIIPAAVHLREGQRCIHPAAQGAMGYALPAAVGAYFVDNREVVAVIGDGSIMMNLQELQTIAHYKLPIKIVVIENNVYSVIRRRQRDMFRNRTIGTQKDNGVSCPNFEEVAHCFGIPYMKIRKTEALISGLDRLFKEDGAVICEISCTEEQQYLHTSVTKDEHRKMVRTPIEDMSPFVDRDLFYGEMVVKPMY